MNQLVRCSRWLTGFAPIIFSIVLVLCAFPLFASTSDDWFSAASTGDVAAINSLINAGAGLNDKGVMSMTPLMTSSFFGKTAAVQVLIDAHANLNLKSGSGLTALMFASKKGYAEIVTLLLDAGADKKLKSASGATALIYATENGNDDVIALLKTTEVPGASKVTAIPKTEKVQAKSQEVATQEAPKVYQSVSEPVVVEKTPETFQQPMTSSTTTNINLSESQQTIQPQSPPPQSDVNTSKTYDNNAYNSEMNISKESSTGIQIGQFGLMGKAGLGIGVPYGVFGFGGEVGTEYFSLLGGFGTMAIISDAGWSIGARGYLVNATKKWRPHLTVLYGTTAAYDITTPYKEYSGALNGLEIGLGVDHDIGKHSGFICTYGLGFITHGEIPSDVKQVVEYYGASMPSFGIPIKLFVGIGYQFGKSASTTKRNNQPEQSQSSETSSQVYDKSTIKKQSESSSSNEILNQVPSQQTLQAKPVSSGTMFVSKDTISLEGRNWYCGDNLIKTKKDWADLYSNNPAALSKWNTAKTLQWCGMGVGVVGIVYECIGLGTMISAAGMPITTEEELAAQTKKSNQADGQLFTGVGIVLLGGLAFYLPAFFCEKSARNIYNTSKKQHEPKLNLELGTNSVRLCYNF